LIEIFKTLISRKIKATWKRVALYYLSGIVGILALLTKAINTVDFKQQVEQA